MSDIIIRRKHGKTPADARASAEHMAVKLKEKFDLNSTWEKVEDHDALNFQGAGLSGSLVLAGEDVALNIQLGFLLSAIKPVIEREIHKFFDENFTA